MYKDWWKKNRRTVRNDMDEYAIQEKNKLKAIDYDNETLGKRKYPDCVGETTRGKQMKKWIKKVISQTTVILFLLW